jgi:ketosteroid isomerase-like protein
MPQENVDLVMRAYAAINRIAELQRAGEDWEAAPEWNELFEPDMVLEDAAEIPGSAVYNGIEEIKRWFREATELFSDARWDPSAPVVRGPHVVVAARGRFRGSSSGVDLEIDVTHVFTVRDGRVTRLRAFFDRGRALEAAEAPKTRG